MRYKYVLYIDNNKEDMDSFNTALDEFGNDIDCVPYNNAREAFKKLNADILHPEIIFVDLNMPVMNGFQFLKEVKKVAGFKIPIVVLSRSSKKDTENKVKELGAKEFISKPNSVKELVGLLEPYFG